jgi:hypothetical protein
VFQYFEEDEDGVPSTNGILGGVYIAEELSEVVVLYSDHSFAVQLLNALPDLPILWSLVCELESRTPVAEIARDNERGLGIIEVWGKHLRVVISHFLVYRSRHYWHNLHLLTQSFGNVGQMHFNRVFILLVINVDHLKTLFILEFVHN